MVDTVRGVLRVRKWPKKRGTPRSALQRWWNDWFRQANKLAKYADGMTQARAIEMTKGSGLYPRDVMLAAMRGRLYSWIDDTGWKWFSVAAMQDISDTLDILAQTVGNVLVRASDRWRAAEEGSPGDVLTQQASPNAPKFAPAAGGGGFSGGCLVNRSTNQSIPAGGNGMISWDVELYDTAGIHDMVVNPTRLTVPAGTSWIRLSAGARWDAAISASFDIRKNGGWNTVTPYCRMTHLTANTLVSPVLAVVPTDYFEFAASNSSGAPRNVLGATYYPWFCMELL